MDPLIIRPGRTEDIGPLDVLLARSYPKLLAGDYPADFLAAALPKITYAQPALVTCGTYFVALQGAKLVGAGGWTRQTPGKDATVLSDIGHIRHFATDVGVVRRGVGSALMAEVLSTATQAGIKHLECYSTRTAVPFYARCGFGVVAEIDVPLEAGVQFPAVRMTRQLDP